MELAQVRLLVRDFAACYHFCADVLGLKPQSGAQHGPYEKFSPRPVRRGSPSRTGR